MHDPASNRHAPLAGRTSPGTGSESTFPHPAGTTGPVTRPGSGANPANPAVRTSAPAVWDFSTVAPGDGTPMSDAAGRCTRRGKGYFSSHTSILIGFS